MKRGETDRPTREQRLHRLLIYDDERVLTVYKFWNYREYLTALEVLTEKKNHGRC